MNNIAKKLFDKVSKEEIVGGLLVASAFVPGPTSIMAVTSGAVTLANKALQRNSNKSGNDLSKQERYFLIQLSIMAAQIDGVIEDEEVKYIEQMVEDFGLQEFEQDLLSFDEKVTFKKLKNCYNSIDKKNKELYSKILEEVVSSDNEKCDIERVLILKCFLLFEGLRDIPMVIIGEHDRKSEVLPNLMEYTHETFQRLYPDEYDNSCDLYFEHPISLGKFIPINDINSFDIANDKDLEFIEAVRIVGAKKVTITNVSTQKDKTKVDSKTKVKTPKVIKGEAGLDVNVALDSMEDEYESYVVEYEGNAECDEVIDRFISGAKWMRRDSQLNWLTKSRTMKNSTTKYCYVSSYTKEVNFMNTVDLALKAKISGVKVEASENLKVKVDRLKNTKRKFVVEF